MKILVIDGNSIVNRAYYGIKILSTKEGIFTNGIYGFLTILEKLKEETNPDAIAVAFDLKAPTFRHKMYTEYKGTRKGMPDELAMQMPLLKDLLNYLGYQTLSVEGYEADDILGTIAEICEKTGDTCVLATGDRDSLQLVSDKTVVRLASTKFGRSAVTMYDVEKVKEDYGVTPKQLIDIKSIQGDSSDNIPGVAGIGEKGAKELIGKFGSVHYIYDNLDELDIKENMKKKLIASKDNALLSYKLGEIFREVPIDNDLNSYITKPMDVQKTAELMTKLELFKLMDRFGVSASESVSTTEKIEGNSFTVRTIASPSALIPMLEDNEKAFVIKNEDKLYFKVGDEIIIVEENESFLKLFAKNTKIQKYSTDVKELYKYIKEKTGEILTSVVMDTGIAAYLLNPSASSYEVARLFDEYGIAPSKNEDETAMLCSGLETLCDVLQNKLEENNQTKLFSEVELPLAIVLGDMELAGIEIDKTGIVEFGNKLKVEIDEINKRVMEAVGYEFNLNSPKQLGKALFEDLHLPHGKKTKTGYSTNAEVLESLRYEHAVVEDILQYRTLTKLNSTYCEGLVKEIKEDGRIHSNFKQLETRTGRISSTEPNLQNIPVRTELGREMRNFFVAKEGHVFIDADYSQIELRVLAHVANDEVMINSFKEGKDIHTATAAKVFNLPEEMVTKKMRSDAKAVNFGIVYGIGAFSLSKDIGVSRKEAETYIDEYLKNFYGVRTYMEDIIAKAKEQGYVEDIFGRRRYLPELKSSNFNMRAFGERVARNMPIQGAAADIIKMAMVRVYDRLKREGFKARLILQVHDELIVEAPIEESQKVAELLTYEMEHAVDMLVPMLAEAGIGADWNSAKN